jgi:signal transduction histidine kinase
MTAQVQPLAIFPDLLLRQLRLWLEPRSTNRDEAFRERTIRATVSIALALTGLTWMVSVLVFRAQWNLISYPTVDAIGFALSAAAALAVIRRQIVLAGWLLIALALSAASGIALVESFRTPSAVPLFMLTVTMAAVVLPRNTILPIGLASTALYATVALVQAGPQDPQVSSFIFTNFVLLLAAGLFLRLLRVEFDLRLADMRDLIKQAEAARQEADRANNAKSQFLANMSHELRTPLNAIIGYVEIMLAGMAGTFTEKQIELQGYVHQNAKRLLSLINDILNLARIESGRLEVTAVPALPRKIITDIVISSQSLAQQKNITLQATFAEDMPEAVLCDVQKVQQIVTNLVGNAIKFTQQGGVEIRVGTTNKNNWEIKVIDTGIGMPEDAPSYIFEKFRQVDSTVTREYHGTGLGLAIVKSLVEGMGGSIQVETALGKGTTFTVTLPRVIQPGTLNVPQQVSEPAAA